MSTILHEEEARKEKELAEKLERAEEEARRKAIQERDPIIGLEILHDEDTFWGGF
jgi:hypothetical protein